ncbi:MAG TPA: NUDIX hydrolase [Candidatus Tumulicola sp.]|jgi:8-oxo-dGTP pyrophosphatase MutT (NUDIX family)
MDDDPYRRVSRRELYRNPWLAVEAHAIVHPSGEPGEHLLVLTSPTCAIVVEDGDELVFARQPRFAARRSIVEIVKGGAEGDEDRLQSARRELREELGVVAGRWSELGGLYEIPSIVAGCVRLYLARDLTFVGPQPESVESITPVRLKIGEALEAAGRGSIEDAVTVAALFRYAVAEGWLAPTAAAPTRDPTVVRARRARD